MPWLICISFLGIVPVDIGGGLAEYLSIEPYYFGKFTNNQNIIQNAQP
jgi:hypothetical protein